MGPGLGWHRPLTPMKLAMKTGRFIFKKGKSRIGPDPSPGSDRTPVPDRTGPQSRIGPDPSPGSVPPQSRIGPDPSPGSDRTPVPDRTGPLSLIRTPVLDQTGPQSRFRPDPSPGSDRTPVPEQDPSPGLD
ncbi:hypothetical protein chiPu_0019344 [Chiloscyllium punctatum]|uniref:Uncharacterized protein n=1 Tax=Chiloscyllium punctatum TaxID=137246 RepID=A0A401RRL8_CHIPU|nr:hypothetical protein [Chiloscyllium punctatum]